MSSDGQFVTGREFDAMGGRMDSFERALSDVGKDVKSLLAAHNREEGAWTTQAINSTDRKDAGARRLAMAGIASGVILGGAGWIQDIVTKLTHHG